jgi:hypothetical protein
MLCYSLFVVATAVILSLKKILKELMKIFCHSLFYSRLVILTSLPTEQYCLLSSEKPFPTLVDKINISVISFSTLSVQLLNVVTVR